jgi:asparagine synthase (glutamine-hydrolysing)
MAGVDKGVKLQGWERKSVLRNTIGKTLPQNILKAPKKGFGIPLREWFKEDSFNHILDNNLHELKNILDKQTIEHIINENKKGLSDNGNFIWTLMLLNQSVK